MSGRRTCRVAVNPILYWDRDRGVDRSPAVFAQAFADLQDIGFTAVTADVPEDVSTTDYHHWISLYGLSPSPGLFSARFDETVDLASEINRARRFAAEQVALGLDRTMVAGAMVPARELRPAVGADFSYDRLAGAVDRLGALCLALQEEGLRALLHPQVGGLFETEEEVTTVLDTLGADVIGFGPDTGHLRWAGMDPAQMVRRYAGRVGGIHLKDVFGDHLEPGRLGRMSYRRTVETGRLWAEPGRGVVDLDAVLAAMPDGYDGDYMIEIDRTSIDSAYYSLKEAYAWATRAFALT
ncbi:sugar phosphate isomerase/epimerase [Georgenia sp. SYP-B2076]|uniref:sugar phosphate isomerase/epimerase family protein n=1 Tax=Georgenia sp. SYP-B2076 TaxID=2495881 RepID=UPI000F8C8770|nr:sugar phosphate isomerase/epimerase [Georgenia sp. SYP-B2076]